MKLDSTGAFFKFQNIGDHIEGDFISFTARIPGKFGPEDQLLLMVGTEQTMVRCNAALTRILQIHLSKLQGKHLSITYTGTKPSKKGNPMKLFDVDMTDPKATPRESGPASDVKPPF